MAIETNKSMPKVSYNLIKKIFNSNLKNKRLLILGVAYKSDIGDTRNTPTKILAQKLIAKGSILDFYDPYVEYWDEMKSTIKKNFNTSQKYDGIILAIAHTDFKTINYNKIKYLYNKECHFIDLTNSLTDIQISDLNSYNVNISFIGQ